MRSFILIVACGLALGLAPAGAEKIDLSTLTCKQFMASGDDEIKLILTWLDAYYKEDAGKLLIGAFEPHAKPWGMEGIPEDFCFDELPEAGR